MKTIVWKPLMIRIFKLPLRNFDNYCKGWYGIKINQQNKKSSFIFLLSVLICCPTDQSLRLEEGLQEYHSSRPITL